MSLLFLFDMDDVLYDYDWRARMAGLTRADRPRPRTSCGDGGGSTGASGPPRRATPATPEAYLAAFIDGPRGGHHRRGLGAASARRRWTAARGARGGARAPRELGTVSLLTNNGPLIHEHLAAVAPEIVPSCSATTCARRALLRRAQARPAGLRAGARALRRRPGGRVLRRRPGRERRGRGVASASPRTCSRRRRPCWRRSRSSRPRRAPPRRPRRPHCGRPPLQ